VQLALSFRQPHPKGKARGEKPSRSSKVSGFDGAGEVRSIRRGSPDHGHHCYTGRGRAPLDSVLRVRVELSPARLEAKGRRACVRRDGDGPGSARAAGVAEPSVALQGASLAGLLPGGDGDPRPRAMHPRAVVGPFRARTGHERWVPHWRTHHMGGGRAQEATRECG
jgi:hypothetical protein